MCIPFDSIRRPASGRTVPSHFSPKRLRISSRSMSIIQESEWHSDLSDKFGKTEKRGILLHEGIPFFQIIFHWKGPFHLASHRKTFFSYKWNTLHLSLSRFAENAQITSQSAGVGVMGVFVAVHLLVVMLLLLWCWWFK